MDHGKYIIIDYGGGIELAILFDNIIDHSIFLKTHCKNRILSAGFFEVHSEPSENDDREIYVSVFGKSTTLGLIARQGCDERLVKRVLRKEY